MNADMEKYTIAFYHQKLKRYKVAMFRAKPGSKTHLAKVLKFDKLRVDLDFTLSELGYRRPQKRGVLKSNQNNTLPFVDKTL